MRSLADVIEVAARAVCLDKGQDPDSRLPSTSADPFRPVWEIEAEKLRDIFVALESTGLIRHVMRAPAKVAATQERNAARSSNKQDDGVPTDRAVAASRAAA